MTNLILVRHGQSIWNKEKRFTGWMDVDLTEKGESEAKLAGQLIKELDIEFHTCFTSCLKRAEKSLKIILEVIDKNIIETASCKKSIKLATKLINGKGRLLVRKSGTESKITIMAESNSKRLNKKCINIIKKTII